MRPTDPRLVRRLGPAKRPLAGVVGAGVVSSLLVLGQAWIVTGLVVAVVHGTPWGLAVVGLFVARAAVGLLSDVAAARAAGAVGTAVRRDLMRSILAPDGAGGAPTGETAVLVTSTFNGNGTVTETWRSPQAVGAAPKVFLQLRVTTP